MDQHMSASTVDNLDELFTALRPLNVDLAIGEERHPRMTDHYVTVDSQITETSFPCTVCKRDFKSQRAYNQHTADSQKHRFTQLLQKFKAHHFEYIGDKCGVKVTSEFDDADGCICISVDKGVEQEVIIQVKNENTEGNVTILMACFMRRKSRVFKMNKLQDVCIPPGNSIDIAVNVICRSISTFNVPLCMHLEHSGEQFHILRSLKAMCSNSLVRDLLPTVPYVKPALKAKLPPSKQIVDGVRPPRTGNRMLEQIITLPKFPLKTQLSDLLECGLKQTESMDKNEEKLLSETWSLLKSPLTSEQYSQRFSLLLHIEEHQMQLDIRHYNIEAATMEVFKEDKKLLCLGVPGLAEKRPSVLHGDHLLVCPIGSNGEKDPKEYQGYVHRVLIDRVALGFGAKLMSIFLPNMKFSVRFVVNRHPLRMEHRAAKLAEEHNCMPWLFPTPGSIGMHPLVKDISTLKLRLYDRKLEGNTQQFQAVQHIVAGSARPGPYLVFGPPGTGKSVTLVEAMKQVLFLYKDAKLLVCAPSNSAADLLAKRLLDHVDKRHILRLYAPCRIGCSIPPDVQPCSNYNPGEGIHLPSKENLRQYRVIVSTLVNAGRIASANFSPGHFTHVFIDESGQAQETEGIIAVAGILDNHLVNPNGGHLILAGDPKQLGPVLRSPVAKKFGLDYSLLERLMNDTEVYSPQNAHCFTKLLRNYRSHPSILKVPNQLFYKDELEACADEVLRNSLCNWEGLPKKNFPVVFHGVMGEDMRENQSPSYFNPQEVAVVVERVECLLSAKGFRVKQKDIGVISPYRKQVTKIRSVFKKKKWDDIKIGSTEEFQGQERLVIIISTVRSCPDLLKVDFTFNLGFLRQPKRFNVAVTRAKALLILIGNPNILRHDKHWNSIIQYCDDNGSYVGERPDDDTEKEIEDVINQLTKLGLAPCLEGSMNQISETEMQETPEFRSDY